MKILLVQPPDNPKVVYSTLPFRIEPLGLEYLGASLAPHHDVKILDMRVDNDLQAVLQTYEPRLVGFTCITVNAKKVKTLSRKVKGFSDEITTVVGGPHVQVVPQDFMDGSTDVIVTDEGMESLMEVACRLEKGKSLNGISGTSVLENGEPVTTPSGPPLNLDSFSLPNRMLTKAYRDTYNAMGVCSIASVRTSTGCPFRCNFCAQWKLNRGRYLVRDPEKVVMELAQIEESYITIVDDEAMADTQRMDRMADRIREYGIRKKYFVYLRSDTIVRHPDLMEKWKNIGLDMVFIGLESLVQDELDRHNKLVSVSHNEQAVRIMKDLDVGVYPNFIVLPEYTRRDFRDLASRVRHLGLPFAFFSVLTPAPGTDYFSEVQPRLTTKDWELFDGMHAVLPTELQKETFYLEMERLHRRTLRPLDLLAIGIRRGYTVRDMVAQMMAGRDFLKRIRYAYQDFDV